MKTVYVGADGTWFQDWDVEELEAGQYPLEPDDDTAEYMNTRPPGAPGRPSNYRRRSGKVLAA